jgi:hypothetical protein
MARLILPVIIFMSGYMFKGQESKVANYAKHCFYEIVEKIKTGVSEDPLDEEVYQSVSEDPLDEEVYQSVSNE